MKNENEPPPAAEPKTTTEAAAGGDEKTEAPKPKRYEFKIAPVDPKNSFDFEDVADK